MEKILKVLRFMFKKHAHFVYFSFSAIFYPPLYIIMVKGLLPTQSQPKPFSVFPLSAQEMPLSCVQVVCDADLLSSCIRLLHLAQTKICSLSTSTANTPR